ncbi:MAG: 50S ribosomal protein L17 [Thermoguttaceae bacterium]|nr:50S ribosomal protein L17 [Thermoguttaceae bacterium]
MQHRKAGRKLGRNPKHQRALLRNLASALILTERDAEDYDTPEMAPKVRGRIVTTLIKAKELRPFVERCVTLAVKAQKFINASNDLNCKAARGTDQWKEWRQGEGWKAWIKEAAPALACRRRAVQLLGSKEAVAILFDKIAPRYVGRPGGYTRILRLAAPRLGDAGKRAIIEFVGEETRAAKSAPIVPTVD